MSISAMTQTAMVSEVANIIGRDATSLSADQTTTYSDRIKQWLYWSHLTIARLYAFPELDQAPVDYTLTASTYAYNLSTILGASNATRVRQIMGVVLLDSTSPVKLRQKLSRTFQEDHPYIESETASKPRQYTLYAQRLEIWPKPSEADSIRVRANYFPANFTSASAASEYINKDDVIIAGAVAHAYISLQENEDAKYWMSIFQQRLGNAIGPQIDPVDWEPEGRAFDYNTQRPSLQPEADPLVMFNSVF